MSCAGLTISFWQYMMMMLYDLKVCHVTWLL